MKFKIIPDEYFITILDRLTRFEPAYVRYKRVFDCVIAKFVIGQNLRNYSEIDKINLAVDAIHNSVELKIEDYITPIIFNTEEKYFNYNELSYQYLSCRLNISAIVQKIKDKSNLPKNIIWLKELYNGADLDILRNNKSLLYPITKIVLCEGETEHVLLGTILKLFGIDFDKLGILLIPAGGKNQVARKYYSMIEYTKIPFFILMDRDAESIKELVQAKLRDEDKIYIIKCGEFEDLIPVNVLEKTINFLHTNDFHCFSSDFDKRLSMVENLENIYKKYGFGDFKKAHFAQKLNEFIIQNISQNEFINSEIAAIAREMQY